MKKLYIEYGPEGMKTAYTEEDKLVDLFLDTPKDESWVGRVVVGRLKTILPGGFAFINIGWEKNAFMNMKPGHGLKAGQPILVQVLKDASGSKSMYVGTELSLRGRYIVLYRNSAGLVGVSRKITEKTEVSRLKGIVQELLPRGFGAIARTNAEGASQTDIAKEIETLHELHMQIRTRAKYIYPPATLYPSAATETKLLLTDILSESISEINISASDNEFTEIKESIRHLIPSLANKVIQYKNSEIGLFDCTGITSQVKASTERILKLPCGGFVTIDETEACVVIDVNTGSNIGSEDYASTVFNTNLEAAALITAQLRLRNLSGIILIDFIDMNSESDKSALLSELRAEVRKDRIKVDVVGMIGLGMVQLTRKKTRPPISEILEMPCPYCKGKGRVRKT